MVAVQKKNNMKGKRKLKNLDKRVQKKNLQKTKDKLSKLSNSELELMRQGGKLAKGESKADYIKRRKGEMSKSSPAKIVPIIAAIGKAALAAGKVAKGIKAGAALAKGVKAVGTAQKIGKAIGTAKKVIGTAKAVKGTMDAISPKIPNRAPSNKGMEKFSQMQFGKSAFKMKRTVKTFDFGSTKAKNKRDYTAKEEKDFSMHNISARRTEGTIKQQAKRRAAREKK